MSLDRIKCFTIDSNKVKRSFTLPYAELTQQKVAHLSLVASPSLLDPRAGSLVFPDEEGKFRFEYDTKVEYEVKLGAFLRAARCPPSLLSPFFSTNSEARNYQLE